MGAAKTEAEVQTTAARIRDNQRRSRARRKEYVETLQQRLDEYERKGVEATLEMQHAARTVAIENSKLRALLAQNGVHASEVDRFLQMYQDMGEELEVTGPASLGLATPLQQQPHHQPKQPGMMSPELSSSLRGDVDYYTHPASGGSYDRNTFTQSRLSLTPPHSSQSTVVGDAPVDKLAVLASASVHQGCCDGITQCMVNGAESRLTSPSTIGPSPVVMTPVSNYPNPLSPVDQLSTSPMEMSCDMAAQIIAEMHGHGDRDKARGDLGCGGQSNCFVRNTALFQILEREGHS